MLDFRCKFVTTSLCKFFRERRNVLTENLQRKRCKNSLSSLLSILLRKLAQKKFWSYACNCCYPTQFAHLAVQAVCMKKRLQKVIIVPRLVTRSLPSVPVNNCRSLKIEHRQIDGSGFISALQKKYHTSYFIMRPFFSWL